MFEVYVREDNPGGQVLMEHTADNATEAESRALRMLIEVASQELTPVQITTDGGVGDGEDEPWGGELIISHDNWDDEYRLVMRIADDGEDRY